MILGNIREGGRGSARRNYPGQAVVLLAVALSASGLIPSLSDGTPSVPALDMVEISEMADSGPLALNGTVAVDAFWTGGGTYLAVAAARDDGIQIVNVTDPSNPVGTGSITDGAGTALDGAYDVDAFGTGGGTYLAVAAVRDDGIQIVNVTDPSNPVGTGSITDGAGTALDGASAVDAFGTGGGTYLAVASYREGVQIVNVTDPSNPVAVAAIFDDDAALLDNARGVDAFRVGGSTYVAVTSRGDSSLGVVNVTDPARPVLIAGIRDGGPSATLLGGARGVDTFVTGGSTYAVVAAHGDSGLQLVDIADPSDPSPISSVADGPTLLLGGAASVTTVNIGSAVYALAVSMFESGVQAVEVTDPSNPVPVQVQGAAAPALNGTARDVAVFRAEGAVYAAVATGFFENSLRILEVVPDGSLGAHTPVLLPVPVSAAYHPHAGAVTVVFDGQLGPAVHADRLHVREAGGGGAGLPLSGRPAVEGSVLTVTLNAGLSGAIGAMASPLLDIGGGAVYDMFGNPVRAAAGIPVDVPDTTPPGIVSATYDNSTGLLSLIFSEPLNHTATDHSGLAVLGSSGNITLAAVADRGVSDDDAIAATLGPDQRGMVGAAPALRASKGAVTDVSGNQIEPVTVPVRLTANRPPAVDAGPDLAVPEGDAVTLNGTASDQDGDTLAYGWTSDRPGLAISNNDTPTPSFTAPQVNSTISITFALSVTDRHNATATDTVTVTVTDVPPPNTAPTASAGDDRTIPEGDAVTLNGTASDPDGDPLAYGWTSDRPGLAISNNDTLTPSFTAPQVDTDTTVTLTLSVTDRHNATATDTVTVTVTDVPPPNTAPTASAGDDRTVPEGDAVELTGTASDQDGDPLAYRWSHDSALNITLAGASTLSPSFTAPEVAANTTVTFTLTATDIHNATASDQAAVTIADVPANRPPAVDAGPDRTVPEGDTVELTGTASDPDGDTLAYGWTSDRPGLALSSGDTPTPFFTTPQVNSTIAITFTLSVTDRHNATAADTVTVTVTDVPANATRATSTRDIQPADTSNNSPPAVDAGPDRTVPEGDTVELTGTASDPDGDTLAYGWTSDRPGLALSSGDTPTPFFTTPQVNSTISITFTLSVTDRHNATAADTVTVTVTDVPANATRTTSTRDIQPADTSNNSPPAVDAGPDRTIPGGYLLTLNGTASDPDGDTLTYLWSHDSALNITLAGADALSTTFIAPQVNSTNTVVITLTVSDGIASSHDSLSVDITDSVPPANSTIPVITLLGPIEMDVQLNSVWTDPGYTATDSDGNDLTGNVTVAGAVDTAQAGIYLLYYQVVDAHGTPAIPQGRSVTVLAPEPQQQTQEPQAEPQQGAELGAEQEPQQEAEQEPTQEHEQEPQQQEDPQEQQEPTWEPEQEPTQEPEQEPESNLPAIVQRYDTDGSGVIEQDEWLVAVDDYTNYELTTPEIRQIAAHRG